MNNNIAMIIIGAICIIAILYMVYKAFSCKHTWEETGRGKIFNINRHNELLYIQVYLKCKKCGDVKSKKL